MQIETAGFILFLHFFEQVIVLRFEVNLLKPCRHFFSVSYSLASFIQERVKFDGLRYYSCIQSETLSNFSLMENNNFDNR